MVSTETSRRSRRTFALVALVSGALAFSLAPGTAVAADSAAAPARAVAPTVTSAALRTVTPPAAKQTPAPPTAAKKKNKKMTVRVSKSPYRFASYRFNKWYAKRYQKVRYGWGTAQFRCLGPMWGRESAWNEKAHNSNGGAHGIPQAQPGSKMASAGPNWQTNPVTQIKWGLGYIKSVYGTPCRAWGFWQNHHWY